MEEPIIGAPLKHFRIEAATFPKDRAALAAQVGPVRSGAGRVLVMMTAMLTGAGVARGEEPSVDRALFQILSDLQSGSKRGDGQRERAAFILRDEKGDYRCVLWPSEHRWREASYSGVVPAGTIAVAHTHTRELPRPSEHDVDEALRSKLTFYIITFWSIYRIDPTTGRIVAVVWNQDWTRSFRRAHVAAPACVEAQ